MQQVVGSWQQVVGRMKQVVGRMKQVVGNWQQYGTGLCTVRFGKRGYLDGVVGHKRWLDQTLLNKLIKRHHEQLAHLPRGAEITLRTCQYQRQ